MALMKVLISHFCRVSKYICIINYMLVGVYVE